jgi:hypothetical protein
VHFELNPRDLGMVTEEGNLIIVQGDYTITIGGGQPDTAQRPLARQAAGDRCRYRRDENKDSAEQDGDDLLLDGCENGRVRCSHTQPENFRPGEPLALKLVISDGDGIYAVRSLRLRFRHVNQAERWNALDASGKDGAYSGAIPAEYTESKFELEYYFEVEGGAGVKWMYPGFNETLFNQPYFAVRRRAD